MGKDHEFSLSDDEEKGDGVEDRGFREILYQVSFFEGRRLSLEDIEIIGDEVWCFGKHAYRRYLFRILRKFYGLDSVPVDDYWKFRIFPDIPDC